MGERINVLLQRPRRLLSTLLLSNTLVNIAFSAIAAVLVIDFQRLVGVGWLAGIFSIIPLLALILFGEVSPKMLAYAIPERWSLLAGTAIIALVKIMAPLVWIQEQLLVGPFTRILAPRVRESHITPDELGALMSLSAERGFIEQDVNDLLQEIVELTDIHVADVMVPRVDIIAHNLDDGMEALIELFQRTHLRKIPVYRGDLDHLEGVVHARRLLLHYQQATAPGSLDNMIRPVPFVPESANLERLLQHFRQAKRQLAFVVDEYGGTAGLISLEDVLEEIVGNIPDIREAVGPPAVEKVSPTEYHVAGELSIHDWADAFGSEHHDPRVSTLGGLITSLLGHIPRPGESVTYHNLSLTVQSVRHCRVERVCVQLIDREEA
jgi:CBS domain containing-hemolysin-like protein